MARKTTRHQELMERARRVVPGGVYGHGSVAPAAHPRLFMSGDGIFVDEYYKIAGKSAEGTYVTFTPDQTKIAAAQNVIKKHRKRFGKEVGAYTIYSYVAANLILNSIQATGGTKGAKMAAHLRSKAWNTSLGKIQFNKKGDVLESPYVFWQVKGSKFAQIN